MGKISTAGVTLLELIIAVVIVGITLFGLGKAFSFAAKLGVQTSVQKKSHEIEQSLSEALGRSTNAFFKSLSDQFCSTGSLTLTYANGFNPEFSVSLFDRALIHSTLDSPLRGAINRLIDDFPTNTTQKCSDPEVLSQPKYSAIGTSEKSKVLCRCSAASTGYETLAPKASDFSGQAGIYSCGLVNQSVTDPVVTKAFSGQLLVESVVSFMNISTAAPINCSEVKSISTFLKSVRFDYLLYRIAENDDFARIASGSIILE